MGIPASIRQTARRRPRTTTATITVIAYAVVLGSFAGIVPVPQLPPERVRLFSHVIAVVNATALTTLLAGVVFVRRGMLERHRNAMLVAFALIGLFLVLYVWKQAGGFTKGLVVQQGQFLASYADLVSSVYLLMLAVHIVLSIVAVPLVVHAIVLGLTHSLEELPETIHPTVGRIAVAAWATSLGLGILTYLLLNHVYSWERISAATVFLLAGSRGSGRSLVRPGQDPAGEQE